MHIMYSNQKILMIKIESLNYQNPSGINPLTLTLRKQYTVSP